MSKKAKLIPNKTPGAQVLETGHGSWKLEIPAGLAGSYRLAQVDDYGTQARRAFPWTEPFRMTLHARASAAQIPGTWGFGLWNNPFGMAIFSGAELLRPPALPNTAWFFFASPENYLSLRDNLPAKGGLAGVFRSPKIPALLLALGAPGLPLLFLPPAARLLRRLGRLLVKEDSQQLNLDVQEWHGYGLEWQSEKVSFQIDGGQVHETDLSPLGPLGLVLWIDNQFAALHPNGRVGLGTLQNSEPAWVEIAGLEIQ